MKWTFSYSILICVLFLCVNTISAQIKSGKIVYERKTNLYKKFKDKGIREWIKEEDKIKIDYFELFFNDSISVFKPQDSDLKEDMGWTTTKNVVYQKQNENYKLSIKKIWSEELYVEDTLTKREWKITDNKRTINNYNCRKAIWEANDSTRIYAWYCDEIIASVGPESFYGLPGAIMGIAAEDGGVIYFAKSVEILKTDVTTLVPKKGKNKIYTSSELKSKLQKDFGKNPWGKSMIQNTFGVW